MGLADEIRQNFEFKTSQKGNISDEENEIYRSLSHSLQVDVAHNISRGLIGEVLIFRGCNDYFLDSISTMLREATIPPGTTIFRRGEVCRSLLIISAGNVNMLNDESDSNDIFRALSEGDSIGEIPFFFNIR